MFYLRTNFDHVLDVLSFMPLNVDFQASNDTSNCHTLAVLPSNILTEDGITILYDMICAKSNILNADRKLIWRGNDNGFGFESFDISTIKWYIQLL